MSIVQSSTSLNIRKGLGSIGTDVARDTFPLPVLGMKLSAVCHDIYDGRGFAIVRGLNPDDYSVEDMTVVYLGVSSYIGERRGKQDQRGSMLSKFPTTLWLDLLV